MCASLGGHVEVAQMLLEHGARVDLMNKVLLIIIYMYVVVYVVVLQYARDCRV